MILAFRGIQERLPVLFCEHNSIWLGEFANIIILYPIVSETQANKDNPSFFCCFRLLIFFALVLIQVLYLWFFFSFYRKRKLYKTWLYISLFGPALMFCFWKDKWHLYQNMVSVSFEFSNIQFLPNSALSKLYTVLTAS